MSFSNIAVFLNIVNKSGSLSKFDILSLMCKPTSPMSGVGYGLFLWYYVCGLATTPRQLGRCGKNIITKTSGVEAAIIKTSIENWITYLVSFHRIKVTMRQLVWHHNTLIHPTQPITAGPLQIAVKTKYVVTKS